MSEEPYRIAVMLPRYSTYGGVERFGCRVAAELARRGHKVDFICARQEIEAGPGVNIMAVGRPKANKRVKMTVFANRADALLECGDYDCAISLGKTLHQDIMRVGGAPLREFWRYSEQAFQPGLRRWLKRLRRRLDPANRLTLEIEERQYASGCKIVAVSHFVRDLIVRAHPHLKAEDIQVIYNKPDLQSFRPPSAEENREARRSFRVPDGAMAIGLATSNFLLKGTGPLIRSLNLLPGNFRLYVAGGRGHAQYDKLAARLKVADRVHFLGRVDDMPRFFQAMDIFALPTFYDACANSVLEALAAGLPVLSSASNGSSYFLPEKNIVQDPGDPEELSYILLDLANEAEASRDRGRRPVFAWPDNVKLGVESFADMVEAFLAEKGRLEDREPFKLSPDPV
ncbi:MAG: glycosyltransferase family 4 protein [Deltaproteobacteria bacterium]|nr:glycosyltransferase family 4 protein [Deltaproteobacteria bacterium]